MVTPNTLAVVVPAYNEQATIGSTLRAMYNQNFTDTDHIIVDNGSTDSTLGVVHTFAKEHDGFPLHVIEEPQKGTGAAADTGMRAAIERGASVLARTDADTIPSADWTQLIDAHFKQNTKLQLLGGKTTACFDADFRRGDQALMFLSIKAARLALAMRHLDLGYLKVINGANMATSRAAYNQVGGFPRSAIDDLDEDVVYSLRVVEEYGRSSVTIDPNLRVATSMRRIRSLGWTGMAIHHLWPENRGKSTRTLDVR